MDDLKELLGEELYKQVVAKLNGQKLIFDKGDLVKKEDYIPKTVWATDKQKLKDQLEERTTEMTTLKDQLKDAEGQPEKLAKIQQTMSDNEKAYKERDKANKAELSKTMKTHAVELALKDADCIHSSLLVPKVNLDSVVELEGKWIVPEAVITGLKEKYKETFGEITPHGEPSPTDPPSKSPKQVNLVELQTGLKKAQDLNDTLGAVTYRRLINEAEKAQRK